MKKPDSITLETILQAREYLRGRAVRTPLIEASGALNEIGIPGRWWIKVESLQRGGSFKFRGALARIRSWAEQGCLPAGVGTYSSGNHALAVALAARIHGIGALVAVPCTIPRSKLAAILACGAEVIQAGTTSEHRRQAALEVLAERGYALIESFDDAAVIAGQGTMALEIQEDCPQLSDIVVPVGGGGLITGIAIALEGLGRAVRVHAVEPQGCDSFGRSLRARVRVEIDPQPSLADGLRPVAPGALALAHGASRVHRAITIDDELILRAMRFYQHPLHLVAEPSGAAALAALLGGLIRSAEDTRGVLILSGGNADWPALAQHLWPPAATPVGVDGRGVLKPARPPEAAAHAERCSPTSGARPPSVLRGPVAREQP